MWLQLNVTLYTTNNTNLKCKQVARLGRRGMATGRAVLRWCEGVGYIRLWVSPHLRDRYNSVNEEKDLSHVYKLYCIFTGFYIFDLQDFTYNKKE